MTVLLAGCVACSSEPPSADRIERRVDAIERSMERTRALSLRTQWTRQLQRALDEAVPAGAMLLPHSLPDLADWRSRELPGDLPRRVELLYRHALLAVVASEPRVRALETQLAAGAGELRPAELRELARERNASARRLGFRDFYTLWLVAQGTTPERVGERLALVESATRGAARSLPSGPSESADDAFRSLDAALAGNAWLLLVGPSPGRKDPNEEQAPGGPNRPIDSYRSILGSANLTGAGLGAKGANRRNFEAGITTESLELIDPVHSWFDALWEGHH